MTEDNKKLVKIYYKNWKGEHSTCFKTVMVVYKYG